MNVQKRKLLRDVTKALSQLDFDRAEELKRLQNLGFDDRESLFRAQEHFVAQLTQSQLDELTGLSNMIDRQFLRFLDEDDFLERPIFGLCFNSSGKCVIFCPL